MSRTAAALIIGNEILTGKIQEKNLAYLGEELFKLGIVLERAVVCRDDVDVIVADLNQLRATHDYVFTSGGVGPTHDDLTLPAVAKAFGVRLVRAEPIAELIRGYHKEHVTEEHLRMADVPEGARMLSSESVPWPTVAIENVFIFPGVPEIFRLKFPVLRQHLSGGRRFYSRAVFTMCDEGEIAHVLSTIAARVPHLFIGSYPRFRGDDYRLKITVDGEHEEEVMKTLQSIVAELPADKIVRIDAGNGG